MKRLLFTLTAAFAVFFSAYARSNGYAFLGEVPTGYTDYTNVVTYPAGKLTDGILTISGTQHSGNICQSNSVVLNMNSNVRMSLTEHYAIHIWMKKAEGSNSDIQFSFCKDNWNTYRAGFEISNTLLSTDEYREIIIKYADRNTANYHCDHADQMFGSNAIQWNMNGPVFHFAAANGEIVYINRIYIEADYENTVIPDASSEKRYYFVRSGEIPTIAGTSIDLRATATHILKQMTSDDGKEYKHLNISNWFAYEHHVAANTDMSDVSQDTWYLKMRVKTTNAAAIKNVTLNSTNTSNCYKLSPYLLPTDGEWREIILSLKDHPGTLTYSSTMSGCIMQWHADGASPLGYLGLDYVYLTNDPSQPEKPTIADDVAPTAFTVTEKAGATTHNKATLQLYAEDEDTPITYTIHYAVKNSGVAPTEVIVNGAQGTTVEKEISGLSPETTYTFSVIASDPNGNETLAEEIEITTTVFVEKRYYAFRSGDLPANSATLTCVDLRPGTGSNINYTNGTSAVADEHFSKFHMSPSGNWGHVTAIPTADALSDVDDTWYLHIRYKSQHPGAVYANVACHDRTDYRLVAADENDNEWKTADVQLNTWSSKTLPIPGGNSSYIGLLQLKTNNDAIANPGNISIDYAYISNNSVAMDLGYQDISSPVVTVSNTGVTASTITLHIEGSDDSDSKIYYTISDGTNNYNVEQNSAEPFDYIIEGLERGTEYNITVNARDPLDNAMTQWAQAITTEGDMTAPEMVYIHKGVVTPKSIELLLKATDNQEGTLTYAISVGDDVYQTTGDAGTETSFIISGLAVGTEYTFSVKATDAGENESAAVEETFSTIDLKASEFSIYADVVDLYAVNGHQPNKEAPKNKTMGFYMVMHNNQVIFKHVAQGEGENFSFANEWDNQVWISSSLASFESSRQEIAAKIKTDDQKTRYTQSATNLQPAYQGIDFVFDMYAGNIFGISGANVTDVFTFYPGYVNIPSNDETAPTMTGVAFEQVGENYVFTFNGVSEDAFFYILSENGTEYMSMVNTISIPASAVVLGNLSFDCYAIDWNANMSAPEHISIRPQISISDNADNATVLEEYNGVSVDVQLTRSLVNASYNTLCLPFDLSAEQVANIFGAGTTIGKLDNAHMKDGDELYLGFEFVDKIEAGVPYIIQPANEVANPLIANVTINKEPNNTVVDGVIAFKGVISPELINEQSAEDHSILLLGANNTLSWPKTTANIKGMRAYFETTSTIAHVARRARFGFESEQTATEIDQVSGLQAPVNDKVIIDGQLFIIREGVKYNALGQKVK